MKPMQLIALTPALILALTARGAEADEARAGSVHPIQVSLWSPVQTSAESDSIYGMRLNLPYGRNRDVHGFDFGVASSLSRDLYGAELGFGGYVERDVRGLQSNLVLSIARGEMLGVQEGIYTSAFNLVGVQAGAVNHVEQSARGARFAAVNVAGGSSQGAEFGIVNHARKMRGLQLGIVNVTDELHGVQIGVANVAGNGFLPFFPVLNAAL